MSCHGDFYAQCIIWVNCAFQYLKSYKGGAFLVIFTLVEVHLRILEDICFERNGISMLRFRQKVASFWSSAVKQLKQWKVEDKYYSA